MTISEAVVKRILELCQQRGITINKISIMSGVTQSTVNDIIHSTTAPRHIRGSIPSRSYATDLISASEIFLTALSSMTWSKR